MANSHEWHEYHTRDIHCCFILDLDKEVAKFLAAKNQAQVSAFIMLMTYPTNRHSLDATRRKVAPKIRFYLNKSILRG